MKLIYAFVFLLLQFAGITSFAESKKIDSLRNVLKTEKEDTNKVNTLNSLSGKLWKIGKYDSSLLCANSAGALAEKLEYKTGSASAFNNIGVVYMFQSNYPKALEYDSKSLAIYQQMGDKNGISSNYSNIGRIYDNQGDHAKGLEYINKALTIDLETGNKTSLAFDYGSIGNIYLEEGDYSRALEYELKALALNQEMVNKEGIAINLGDIGIIYINQGNYQKSMEYASKALVINTEIGNKSNIAINLNNIGSIYISEGNYPKALEYSFKSLSISKELGDKSGVAGDYTNIANAYFSQNDFREAMEYMLKALATYQEIGDKQGIANTFGNIGYTYQEQQNYPKALEYSFKSLSISKELGDKFGISSSLSNIGNIYYEQRDYTNALKYATDALSIKREIGDKEGIAINLGNIGNTYTKLKKYQLAKVYLDSTLYIAKSINKKDIVRDVYSGLASLDSATGNYKVALQDYKNYIICKDSLVNDENTKKTVAAQMNYDFDQKQAAEKAEQDKKDAVAELDKNKQKVIRNSFIGGFALMLALAFFIFRGYRQKQKANIIITQQKELVEKQRDEVEKQKHEVEKQKDEVVHQKAIVEEKNKDILDSITYAKRLQDAILPPLSLIKQYLPESFLLYKPKDIVAGDFYWMERVTVPVIARHEAISSADERLPRSDDGTRSDVADEVILIAAADCTGHGVPGALVSVVCSNALNRTVKEFKIIEPGKILDKVRELVLETFEKSGEIQDGMDISLCCINTKTNEVQWSGAYNSLWYIQNNEIKEVAADKQPIGKTDKPVPFSTNNLNLQKGDTLYLFTDGYADQFGGPKGKKFKYKQFQEKLLAISSQSMAEQKDILDKAIEEWRGSLEQVDDVLVIGIKV